MGSVGDDRMFFLVQTIEIISTNKLHPNFKPRVIGKIILYRDYEPRWKFIDEYI